MTLLDTHVLLWLAAGDKRIGRRALRSIQTALKDDSLFVSAISYWEVGMLIANRRIQMEWPARGFRRHCLGLGVRELSVDGEIAIVSIELASLPTDPADRIIVAAAIINHAKLVTADQHILSTTMLFNRQDAEE